MTSPSRSESNTQSYFVGLLAEQARLTENAAPADLKLLTEKLTYLTDEQIKLITSAHAYASRAHDGQWRRTGHEYISHPTAVASILADMRMDHQTLMAALLHDVIEDSSTSKSSLGDQFGRPVAEIVDGVSKLTKIFSSRAEAQAENFQKMALAMAKDIRVIMVKMADRLHNMRTIGVMSPTQRKRIARETLDFYAPIANRLGIHSMKTELEELGFKALYPLRANRIERAVKAARGHRTELMEEITSTITAALNRDSINGTVHAREKLTYSIYRKMKTQHKPFAEIMDVFGFRIVVDQVDACYRTLGMVHNLFKPVAGRFKDYIAIPKANGYQSLHTSLFGMHGVPIEVQIRTKQMEAMAENGIAGHWLYRAGEDDFEPSQRRARQWVQDLLELQRQAGNPLEFIESLKLDLFPDEVYVFTPNGDIMALPRGACPIDFAYAVHTDIGNTCVACRVDRSLAPLSQQLQSGQSVEIITSNDARVNPDWLTFVVTSRARSAIRVRLKNQQGDQSVALGRKLLNRALGNANTSINDLDFRRLRRVFTELGVRKLNDLLAAIGNGDLMAYVAAQKLLAADNPDYEAVQIEGGGPIAIRGGEGLVIHYGRCCGPAPGDQIVGHMTPGKGFVVHIETCPNITELRRRATREIIPARWTSNTEGEFLTTLLINVNRRKGILAEIAAEVTAADAGVDNMHVEERSAEVSTIVIGVTIKNRSHLARVMRRLRNIQAVINLARKAF
ncbi:MAG: RelA/SpoT family protein [Gammaproteobacteria bacterium]|jgi:GTP diphosphokinase / guanosine-3',5'-bis(diphosphate) 3'-diphosphatase|nr:RelA/SpoT family protein [Gammaproteobacteria bacterium]